MDITNTQNDPVFGDYAPHNEIYAWQCMDRDECGDVIQEGVDYSEQFCQKDRRDNWFVQNFLWNDAKICLAPIPLVPLNVVVLLVLLMVPLTVAVMMTSVLAKDKDMIHCTVIPDLQMIQLFASIAKPNHVLLGLISDHAYRKRAAMCLKNYK